MIFKIIWTICSSELDLNTWTMFYENTFQANWKILPLKYLGDVFGVHDYLRVIAQKPHYIDDYSFRIYDHHFVLSHSYTIVRISNKYST